MKPNLMIIGAQKCATTSLFVELVRHPDVAGCRDKEPHFFSTCRDWREELPRYKALFDEGSERIVCEASTSYTFFPHRNPGIWDDLHAYEPDLRFIYIARHPVERIRSSWTHSLARGHTAQPLERLLRENPLLLDATRYHTQVAPFIERFGRDAVLLLRFEDVVSERDASLQRIAGFLGIDPHGFAEERPRHSNRSVGRYRQHPWTHRPPALLRPVARLAPRAWKSLTGRLATEIDEVPRVEPQTQRTILRLLDLEIRALDPLMQEDLSAWRQPVEDAERK